MLTNKNQANLLRKMLENSSVYILQTKHFSSLHSQFSSLCDTVNSHKTLHIATQVKECGQDSLLLYTLCSSEQKITQ